LLTGRHKIDILIISGLICFYNLFFQENFSQSEHHFRAFAANFLVICLKRSGYFGKEYCQTQTQTKQYSKEEVFVGAASFF
jgi:hypothetical protein